MRLDGKGTSRRLGGADALAIALAILAGSAIAQAPSSGDGSTGVSTTQPAAATIERAVDPHWSATGCGQCHTVTDGRPAPIEAAAIDALCLGCHDGRRASSEFHPIGRTFTREGIVRPKGWPAPGGRLSCATCHDIRSACHRERRRPTGNGAFLRGPAGSDRLAFCGSCHVSSGAHERYNPHRLLDEHRQVVPQACQFCHDRAILDANPSVRTGRALLRGNELTLCLGCHDRHVDYFEPGHIGIRVPPEMRAYMLAAEQTPAGARVDPERIRQALGTSRPTARLPLARGGRVVCSTCHNPHQAGAFPPGSVLGYGATRHEPGRERLAFRGLGKGVCRGCHNP